MRFLLLCLLVSSASLSAQVSFKATSDARQVIAGQYFTVTFALQNADGSNFKAPDFGGLSVAGGPSRSQMRSSVNGRVTTEVSFVYSLVADKPGNYTIAPATLRVNGQEIKSNPIRIEVVKGRDPGDSEGAEPFIIEATIDHDTGYVGQQLTLKYTLLTNQAVRQVNFGNISEFDGFFAKEIKNYRSSTEQVVRDGIQYSKRVIGVFVLFPQQKGVTDIEPVNIVLGVSEGGRRSNNIFFTTRLKQHRARSNGLTIQVLDLPEGAPDSFSGAIGDFYMGTSIDKKTITQEDALTLTLQIKGDGDGRFIEPPLQPYTDLFDIYDPNLLNEQEQVIGDKMQVVKTYEYLMIPKKTGTLRFQPEMTFYDVDSSRYEVIKSQQYTIRVVPGTGRESADLDLLSKELPPPRSVGDLRDVGKSFAWSWGHIGLNGVFIMALGGMLVVRRQRDIADAEDPDAKRRRLAQEQAVKTLDDAKQALDNGDIKEYYIRIRQALQRYLSDKASLPTDQLSKSHISMLMIEQGLERHLDSLLAVMQKGEQAIYASIAPGQEQGDYDTIVSIIKDIELSL